MATREAESDRRPLTAIAGSVAITPSDSTILSPICHKLFGNATAGQTVKLRLLDGSTPTLTFAAGNFSLDVQYDVGENLSTGCLRIFN
jgi:hypothetical protein